MTTYQPASGVFVGAPPCGRCRAAFRLHVDGMCPTAYRPGTLEEARRALEDAERSGDPGRVFVARGEVQRLEKAER